MKVISQRPPSSAGIGRIFMHAKLIEIIAVSIKTISSPIEMMFGKISPITKIGPETLSPAFES